MLSGGLFSTMGNGFSFYGASPELGETKAMAQLTVIACSKDFNWDKRSEISNIK